ncbi:MAG: hypothetical protein AAFN74_13860 [Myxococcota bacterium]
MIRLYVAAVYVVLWGVALTAPPTTTSIGDLFAFRGPDEWSIAIFNLMGVWPILFAAPLWADGPMQRVPAWPFVILSFAAGAFILGPYLLLRNWTAPAKTSGKLLALGTHPVVAVFCALAIAGLFGFGLSGSMGDYVERVVNDGFVRTYSMDFVAITLLYPVVAGHDRARLGRSPWVWWLAIPMVGAVVHLWQRRGVAVRPAAT